MAAKGFKSSSLTLSGNLSPHLYPRPCLIPHLNRFLKVQAHQQSQMRLAQQSNRVSFHQLMVSDHGVKTV